MTARKALWLLIVGSAMVRLVCACTLGLGNDEAYHFLYATHPDLSYYDHPPMMAWVEMAGLTLSATKTSAWALRIGFIVLFGGSTWLLARLTARVYGDWAGFMAAFTLNITGYYGLAAATFALPDGPLLFFWLLTIDRLAVALADSSAHPTRPWLWVGLAWGGAMLSKYHAVFLPMGLGLYLLLHPPARRWFLRPGPYIALALGLVVFSPVLWWNAGHGWASFLFQGGRAVGTWTLRPEYLLMAILAQAAYLFPWIWGPLVLILVKRCWSWRTISSADERLWVCLAIFPLTVFTAVACFRPVLPHWGLIGLVSLFPLLGGKWAVRFAERPRSTRRLLFAGATFSVLLVLFATGEYRFGWLQRDGGGGWGLVDVRTDPTLDLYGWDQVADRITQLGLVDDPRTFVFSSYWYQSAHLAYALGRDRSVLCYNADDPRGFAFWSRPEEWIGRDGVLVVVGEIQSWPRYFARWFRSVEPVADFWVQRNGKPVRRIQLYRCTQQRLAFPFAIDRAERLARMTATSKNAPASAPR
jgi:hypothetical protein